MTLFTIMCQKSKVKGKVKAFFTLYQHKTDKIRLKINIFILSSYYKNWQSFNYNLDFVINNECAFIDYGCIFR